MDIYLFSNGQQCSPPRKYHLQTEDLKQWDSILNHLARLHYGSLQAIDLHTLDGQKLKSSLGLQDGMAYVAVVPPEAFIDSGYEKYLIKASRSWEKRQAKKTAIIEISDDTKTDVPKAENVLPAVYVCTAAELTTLKMPDENIGEESAVVKPLRSSAPKLDKSDIQPHLKSVIASPRQTNASAERRRLSGQHTKFVKTANTINSQQIKKSIPKSKEGFNKQISTKIPKKVNEQTNHFAAIPKKESTHLQESVRPPMQPELTDPPQLADPPQLPEPPQLPDSPKLADPPQLPEPSQLPDPPKLADPPQLPEPSQLPDPPQLPELPQFSGPPQLPDPPQLPLPSAPNTNALTTLNKKIPATEGTPVGNLTCDKDVIVVDTDIHKIPKNETRSVEMKASHGPPVDEVISCYLQNAAEKEIQTQNLTTAEVNTPDIDIANSKMKAITTKLIPNTNAVSCAIPLDDNYIAVINKGDAVNMSLIIELQNNEILDSICYSDMLQKQLRKVSSLMDIIDQNKLHSPKNEEIGAQTKSLQSVINTINKNFANVVVVQCACCGNNTAMPRMEKMPVYKDDNGFFILMQGPALGTNLSCACDLNCENICLNKNIMSELCLGKLTELKPKTNYSVRTQDAGMVMTVKDFGVMPPALPEQQKNIFNSYMVTNQEPSNENQCNFANSTSSKAREKTEPASFVEKSTQTEWGNLLLLVKCREDGHCTFHLPSLEVLKYNLL